MAASEGPLARLKRGLQPGGFIMVAALLRVGNRAVQKAKQAFEDQQRAGVAWPPRNVPNVAGLLEDAKTSSTPKERRFETRPAGQNSGRLKASQSFQIVGGNTVLVGSTLDYASNVQRGGETTIQVTEIQRQNLRRMISKDRRLQLAKRIWKIASGKIKSLRIKTPPRPFLADTDEDKKERAAILNDEVRKALAGP